MLGSVAWSTRQATCSSMSLHWGPARARVLYCRSPRRILSRYLNSSERPWPSLRSSLQYQNTSLQQLLDSNWSDNTYLVMWEGLYRFNFFRSWATFCRGNQDSSLDAGSQEVQGDACAKLIQAQRTILVYPSLLFMAPSSWLHTRMHNTIEG